MRPLLKKKSKLTHLAHCAQGVRLQACSGLVPLGDGGVGEPVGPRHHPDLLRLAHQMKHPPPCLAFSGQHRCSLIGLFFTPSVCSVSCLRIIWNVKKLKTCNISINLLWPHLLKTFWQTVEFWLCHYRLKPSNQHCYQSRDSEHTTFITSRARDNKMDRFSTAIS